MTHQYQKVRCQSAVQIVGLDDYVDIDKIELELNSYIEKILSKLNLEDLNDWRILLNVIYTATQSVGVFKSTRRYPSDTEIESSIIIPIPSVNEVKYGLPETKLERVFTMLTGKWHLLQTDFTKFENLENYIYDAVVRGIDETFKQGITVNGKKIKYQN
jgi:Immunity protein 9